MARRKEASRTKPPSKPGRLDASAWIDAGLELLAEGGVQSVRIDELARALGVTKGSFYWHFEDRAHLLRAMLEKWRRDATFAVIARLEADVSPAQRIRRLIDLPVGGGSAKRGQNLELAIRLWANHDPGAAAAIEEIDQHRLSYLVSQLRGNGMTEAKAAARAYLIYAFILAESFIPSKASAQVVSDSALRRLADDLIQSDGLP
jgi:AcrR family transcriptional regulator